MTTIRIGDRVRLPYLGGVEGKLAEIPAVPPGVVVVGLDGGGAWHGMGNMLEKIVPPDLRHPAVVAAREGDGQDGLVSFGVIADPDSTVARYLIAGYRWAAESSRIDDNSSYAARWLEQLANEVEATIVRSQA